MMKPLATEVGKSVQIVGRSEYPLGELVTIQGTWVFAEGFPPPKDDSPRFFKPVK